MDAIAVPLLLAALCLQPANNANTSGMALASSIYEANISLSGYSSGKMSVRGTYNRGVLAQSDYSSCLESCLNQRCRPAYDLCQQISDDIADCNRQWDQCYQSCHNGC